MRRYGDIDKEYLKDYLISENPAAIAKQLKARGYVWELDRGAYRFLIRGVLNPLYLWFERRKGLIFLSSNMSQTKDIIEHLRQIKDADYRQGFAPAPFYAFCGFKGHRLSGGQKPIISNKDCYPYPEGYNWHEFFTKKEVETILSEVDFLLSLNTNYPNL